MSGHELGDDDDDCGDEFVGYNEWAVGALGVALFTDFVYDYEDGERGVFVAEDIAPQTRVLSVPFASLLTLEWLRAQAASGHDLYSRVSLFRALAEAPPGGAGWDAEREDDLLALALLYERFVARADSHWRPHLDLLPKSYDNLLYFTRDEIQRLRGSVFLMAQQVHSKVQEDYERLRTTVLPELFDAVLTARADMTQDELEKRFSIEQYKWALSTIWSRFVSLTMAGNSEILLPVLKAMAPVFDMLNHDPYAEISHGYNVETHALEVVTHQHVTAGTQLCIHYGAVSNHKLLTLYGFVVPGNPYDTMEFWLPMDETTTTMIDAKARLLLELGIDHEVTAFELSAMNEEDVDPAMLLAARVIQLECKDENELAQCVEKIKFGEIVSDANEARALGMLIYKLEMTLEQYVGDDADNEEGAFEKVEPGDERRHAHHLQMINDVRESDRLILENTIGVLEAMLINVLPARQEKLPTATSPT